MTHSGVSRLTTPETSSVSPPKMPGRPSPPPMAANNTPYWLSLVVIIFAYLVMALIGDLLRPPDSSVSLIWPAAGLALVALLKRGLHLWPAIWIGAFIYLHWLVSPSVSPGLAFLIASGTTLQALVGAYLTQRFYDPPTLLSRERDVGLFLLLAGPLACLISPSVGNISLYGAGLLTAQQMVGSWLLWWSADTMGVLLVAPLLLATPLAGPYFPKSGIRMALPLLITAVLLLSGNIILNRLEQTQAHEYAERMMEETYDTGLRVFSQAIEPLRGVERIFSATEQITPKDYAAFANYVAQQPAILSTDWAPRIGRAERLAFEQELQREDNSNLRILERNSQGQPTPAAQRDEYFPVALSEPAAENAMILGFDHNSQVERRRAMAQARDSAKITLTSLTPLMRTKEQALLAFTPVYRPGFNADEASVANRQQALRGFFVVVFSLKELLTPLDSDAMVHQLLYRISDITPEEGMPQNLLGTLPAEANPHWKRRIPFANRIWQLEMEANKTFWQPWTSLSSRLYLLLSVVGAFLISLASLSAAGRNAATAGEVIERTAELALELHARQAAEEEIRRLNLDLEAKVEERTRALEALHLKEEQLSAIVGNLPYGLVTIDARGIVHSANPAIEQVLGYRPAELIGNNVSLLMPEPHRSLHVSYIQRYLETGETRIIDNGREVQGQHKDGRLIPLELAVTEYRVHGERYFIGSIWDISERQQFIEELTRARLDAEQASRAKSSFLAVMSHEIRTPMNGVIGLVDVLAHSRLSDYQAELIGTIRESATTLLGIIDDILDFSKIDAGRMSLEHNPVCLADIVEGLCSSLQPDAASKGVAISLFVSPKIPQQLLSDSVRLRQALGNLIGNAIKFSANQTRRKGLVSIRVTPIESNPLRVAFEIIDNGIGMSQSTLNQLFTPFTQAEASTTRRFGGTGLGLAITHRLVGLMQGEITVSSRPGAGSRFTITLPFETSTEQPAAGEPELAGVRCIVLKSAELNDTDLLAYLEHAGAEVIPAEDIQTAVQLSAPLSKPVVAIQDAEQQRPSVAPELAAIKGLRHLQLTRGRRQRARLEALDVVSLDYPFVRRQSLFHAVALAAGRASPKHFHESPLPEVTEFSPPPTIDEARAQDRLILVAEDDALNQRVILQQLALLGYAAEVAANGTDALRLWRKGSYALVLTDLQMPDMDGYTLARTIRQEEKNHPRIPILALTANALREEEEQTKSAGMDAYLTKPLQLRQLREVLENWLPKPDNSHAIPPVATPSNRNGFSVDVGILRDMVGDDDDTVLGLLSDYLESLNHLTQELHTVYGKHDIRQVCAITHKLKSSSRVVGALALGDLCAEIERAAKAEDISAIDAVMPQFEAAVTAAKAEIKKLIEMA